MYEASKSAAVVKVCHVAMGDLWAGAEVQLLALMKYLVRLPGFEWDVVLFNEGRLADELRKLPILLTIIPERDHSPSSVAHLLAKKFRQVSPNIVHTHKYKDSILASIVARCLRVPHVVRVVHGMPEPFKGLKNFKMAGYTLVDRFVTRWFVDKVVAVSFDLETVLAPIYGTDRVTCIHNGIDLETVHVAAQRTVKRKEWQIDDRAIVIGTVGRLVPVKGQSILLESFRTLRNSKYNVKLLLVGDGPLRGHLEAEVKRLSLEQEVLFAGHQEQSYDFINMMDIFVLPSLHEGIPMVLLEALALKKPVIASRVGGIPEVVSHGTSGILVKPANPDELATGLKRLVEDHEKAQQLGNAGRCRVEQEFDASLMAARTAAVYQSLCKPANR
jgi:glycosyltransferase involved in cell wall biosynthesis